MVALLAVGKALIGVVSVLGSIRYGTGIYFWRITEKLEKPEYEVIQKLSDGVEIRRYKPYLIAETTVENGYGFREPTRDGFRTCAGYIFGKNKKVDRKASLFGYSDTTSEKMAMTAPVRISGSSGTTSEKMEMTAPVRINGGGNDIKTKVSFIVGSKYTKKTAPKPIDKNVTIREIASHVLAVRTFSGPPPRDDTVMKERARIEKALIEANMRPKQKKETLLYGYHDPFLTPNFLRRNEVAVLIEGSI